MAGKSIQYNLQINADSSQAKHQLQDLSKTLSAISSMNIKTPVEDSAIRKASEAAKELQVHLQSAINVDTGKLNLTSFNQSLRSSGTSVTELSRSLLEAGNLGQQAFTQLTAAISNTEVPIRRVNKTLADWGQTIKNTVKWEISSTMVHGLESALSGAVNYAKDLNKSLTDIRIVTGQSSEDMAAFAERANRAAKELATSTKAYAEASLIYYQQGDSDELVAKKAALTLKAANASAHTSAEEMSEYLTAVWNSYQVGADELERYVDIMAALGAKTATSLEEIATSMQKVAATGNTVGVSMEQVSSIIATVSSVTRESAQSIGTSFKTIFARMGDLKIGEEDEDGIGLGKVSEGLSAIGIEILNANGDLRDMGDVITELGDKWQTMTNAEKAATAQLVAGKRQYTQLMALFENWDMFNENMDISNNAEGALQDMQDIYTESWAAASKKVQASLESIYNAILDDQGFIALLNSLEKIINTIDGVIDGFGGLKGVILNVGGLMANLFSADIAQGLTKTFTTVSELFKRTGDEQEQYLQHSRQIRAELEAVTKENTLIDQGTRYETTGIAEVMRVQEQMVERSKSLTSDQKAHIEGVIAAYQEEVAAIVELQKEQDKMQKKANMTEEALKQNVMEEEMSYLSNRDHQKSYHQLSRKEKEAIYNKAQETSVSDAFDLPTVEIETKLDTGEIKKEIITVEKDLQKAFGNINLEGLTLDKVMGQAKQLTTQTGQLKTAFAQLKEMTGENGINLFAADKSLEDITSDLARMQEVYQNIMGEPIVFTIDTEDGEQKIEDLSKASNLTKEQLLQIADQMTAAFASAEQVTAEQAAAIKRALLKIVPPELKEKFAELFKEWEKLGTIGTSTANRVEAAMKAALQRMNNETEKIFSDMSNKIQNAIKITSAISSIQGAINTIKGTIDTLKSPDVSGWEKFGAVISAVSTVLMTMHTVSQAMEIVTKGYNALVLIGTGIEIANTAAKNANAEATRNKTKATAENMTVEELSQLGAGSGKKPAGLKDYKKALKGLGKQFGNIIAKGKTAMQLMGGFAKANAAIIGSYAIIAASAAALVAIGVTIYTAEKKRIAALKEEAAAIVEASNAQSEATKKVSKDTADLDQVMHDATLSYEQQLDKINEIAKAYGVQAGAVDALNGSYSQFKQTLIDIIRLQNDENVEDSNVIMDQAEDNYNAGVEGSKTVAHDYGAIRLSDGSFIDLNAINTLKDKNGQTYQGPVETYEDFQKFFEWANTVRAEIWGQDNIDHWKLPDIKTFYQDMYGMEYDESLGEAGSWEAAGVSGVRIFNDEVNTAKKSLYTDAIWDADGIGEKDKENKNITALDNLDVDTRSSYLSGEGHAWISIKDHLKNYGFYLDDNMNLKSTQGSQMDFAGLWEFLQNNSNIKQYSDNEDSYTHQILSQIKEYNPIVENYAAIKQQNNDAKAIQQLWQNSNFTDNVLSPDLDVQSLEETQELIQQVLETKDENGNPMVEKNIETAKTLASTLTGYESYQASGNILTELYDFADLAVPAAFELKPEIVMSDENLEQQKFNLVESVLGEFSHLTLDTVIRLSPSDVVIDEDGNVSIDENAQEYLDALNTKAKSTKARDIMFDNEEIFGKKKLTEKDIDTISSVWSEANLGEYTDIGLDEFLMSSEETRQLITSKMIEQMNRQKHQSTEKLLELAEERIAATGKDFETWETAFNNTADEVGGAHYKDIVTNLMPKNQQIIDDLQTRIDAYNKLATDKEKEAFDWGEFAVKDDKGKIDLEATQEKIRTLTNENEQYQAAIDVGQQKERVYLQAIDDQKRATGEKQVYDFASNFTEPVEKATTAVEKYKQAITDATMSGADLAELEIVDPGALEKYQNLSDSEWLDYSYEQAQAHMAELEELYQNDAYMLLDIAQQKEEIDKAYYARKTEIAKNAYDQEINGMQETLAETEKTAEAMAAALSSDELTQEQIIAMGDQAQQWKNADAMKRLSMYGAAIGNQALQKIAINNKSIEGVETAQSFEEVVRRQYSPADFMPDMEIPDNVPLPAMEPLMAEMEAKAAAQASSAAQQFSEEFADAMTKTDDGSALQSFFGDNLDAFSYETQQVLLKVREQMKGTGADAATIWDAYLKECEKVGIENDKIWQDFEQSALSAIMTVLNQEQEVAQQTVDLWKQAIKDIENARLGLANGDSILETFGDDEEGLANVIMQLKEQGKTAAEIQQIITSTDADTLKEVKANGLTMEQYGESRGVLSAITQGANGEAPTLIEDYQTWFNKVTTEIKASADEIFETMDAETKAAYDAWQAKNEGQELADYIIESYGLNNESKAQELYHQEYASALTHQTMYGTNGTGGVRQQQTQFDEAMSTYETQVSETQQRMADLQQIQQIFREAGVFGANSLSDLSTRLGGDAAGIMSRLGLRSVEELNSLTSDSVSERLQTESATIQAAEVTLQGNLRDAGLIDDDGRVRDEAAFMAGTIEEGLIAASANTMGAAIDANPNAGPTRLTEQETIDYLQGLDSQFSALDAFENDVNVENLLALRDALDMSNESIRQYYEAVASAETTEERELAIDALTQAILQQNDAELTESQTANLLLQKYQEQYGIMDLYGKSLTVNGIKLLPQLTREQRKAQKVFTQLNKEIKNNTKNIKFSNESYEDMTKLYRDVAKAAKSSGRTIAEVAEEIEGVTDEEREAIIQAGEDYQEIFTDLTEDLGQSMAGLPEDMRNAISGADLEGLFNSLLPEGAFNNILAGIDAGNADFQAAVDRMKTDSSAAVRAMGAELQAAAAANGQIDLGSVIEGLGVDLSNPIEVLNALVELLSYLAGVPYFEGASAALAPVAAALSKTQAVQNTYGGGGNVHNANKSSGGGGGGGGGNKEKKEYKRYKDEIDRYHVQNANLERIGEELDEIDKLKDRAYGSDHVAQLDAETEALKRQYDAQVDLYNEAMKWQSADRAELVSLGVGVQFSENGNISNYEEVMQKLVDKYNAEIDVYNESEQEEGDKLRLEDAEEAYEDAKKAIENYEEAVKTANQAQIDMEEILNSISEIELEKITYELELDLEVNEKDIELLEYFKSKYEETLHAQDELFGSLMESAAQYEDNLAQIDNAYRDLLAARQSGTINESDYADGLKDLSDKMLENLENLQDVANEIAESYSNTLELAREEIDKTLTSLDSFNEAMQSYISIAGLSGKSFFKTDAGEIINSYKGLEAFYDAQFKNNLNRIIIQREHLEVLTEEESRFRDKIASGETLTDLEKKQYAALQEQIEETRSGILSATEDSLSTLQEAYENTINGIAEELDSFMAGAAGSLAHLADQYSYFQEQQSRYVSTAKELYEVSKLSRDIENSIAEASTNASKEALKALQEKINKQSELNELTEYDIQMNQLQYQLLLARIQLEEAQNAKDTVRLTRDDNGNYAYQYTADQGKVDEALQNYEDVLQQINDLTTQRTSEIEQQMIDSMQSYKDQFQEIALDQTLTAEQRNERLAELNNRFSETMTYLQEQNGIVTENLTLNQEAIAQHYGVNMAEITASTAGNVNETVQSMIDKTEEYIAAMNAAIFGEDGASTAWQEYAERIGLVNEASGTSYSEMIQNTEEMGEMNEYATNEALNTISTLEDTIKPLGDLTDAWNVHNETLQETISYYEELVNKINSAVSVLGETDTVAGITMLNNLTSGSSAQTLDEILESEYGAVSDYLDTMSAATAATLDMPNDQVYQLILDTIDHLALMNSISPYSASSIDNSSAQELLQTVTIQADFPNATDQNEIVEAFETLINRASQFASRKKM